MQDHKTVDHSDKGKRKLVEEVRTLRSRLSELEQGNIIGTQGVGRDITDRRRQKNLTDIQRDLAVKLSAMTDLGKGLELCLETAIRASGMDCGGVYLVDESSGGLEMVFHKGLSADFVGKVSRCEPDSPKTQLVRRCKSTYAHYRELKVSPDESEYREGLRAIAVLPVFYKGCLIGCLNVASHTLDEVPIWSRTVLETISAQIGSTVVRLKAETALRDSEEKFRSIFEQANDGIVYLNESGLILDVNQKAAQIFGGKTKDILNRHFTKLGIFSNEDMPTLMNNFTKIVSGAETTLAVRIKNKKGRELFLECTASLTKQSNQADNIMVVVRDVTERKKAEEAVLKERDKLVGVFEAMEDGVYIVNQQHDIQYVNPVLEKSFGPSQGRKCYQYFHDRKEVCPWCKNDDVFAGKTVRWEWYSFKNQKTYDLIDTPLKNPDGSISKLEILRDITERKQAEEALRESENKYRMLFENTSMPVSFWSVNDWRILSMNAEGARKIGITPEEAIGKTTDEVFYDSDAAEKAREIFKEVLESGKGYQSEDCVEMLKGVKIWFRSDIQPVTNETGQVTAIQTISEDITDRKKAEEAMRESEERFRTLFESAPDGIFLNDLEGRFVDGSDRAEELIGYGKDELIGKTIAEANLLSTEQIPMAIANLKKTADGKPTGPDEFTLRKKDGSSVIVEVRSFPVEIAGQTLSLGIARDITERKKAQETLMIRAQILENMVEGVNVSDNNRTIFFTNPKFDSMFGYKPGELIGKHISILNDLPREENTKLLNEIIEQLDTTGSWSGEFTNCRKDGTQFVTSAHISVLCLSGKNCWISVREDITERKKAEELLKMSELRIRSLIEQTTDAVFCYEYDPPIPTNLPIPDQVQLLYDGVLVECNDVCAKSYGANRAEEVVGRKLTQLFGAVPGSLDKLFTALVEGGYHIVDGEGVEKLEDGTERYYLNNGHGVIEDGKLLRVWGTFRDITERRKAQDELRQFKTISDGAGYGAAIIDVEGSLIYVNESFAKMHGYRPEELIGKHVSIFHTKEQMPNVERLIKQLMREGNYVDEEVWHKRKDGTVFLSSMTGTCIMDEKGKPLFMAATAIDITERKKAEEKIRQQKEFLQNVLESLTHPFYVIDAKDYRIKMANPAGYEGKLSEKTTCHMLSHKRDKPCDGATHCCPLEEIKKTKRPAQATHIHYDKDGNPRNIEVHGYPILDGQGNVIEIIEYCLDVTEREKAQEGLRESEEKYRQLVSTTTDAIMLFDAETRQFVDVNKACEELYGYSREEFLKLRQQDITAEPEESELSIKEVAEGKLQRIPVRYHKKKDGTAFPVEISGSTFELRGRKVLCGVIRDITERKQAEDALQREKKLNEELFKTTPAFAVAINAEGKTVMMNDAMCNALGYTFAEINGADYLTTFVPKRNREELAKIFKRLATTRESAATENYVLTRDGRELLVDWQGSRIFNSKGELEFFFGIGIDITERKKAQIALNREKKFAEDAINAQIDTFFVFNPKTGKAILWNKNFSKISGYSDEEIAAMKAPDSWYSEEDLRKSAAAIRKVDTEGYSTVEISLITKSGEKIPFEYRASIIKRESDEPLIVSIGRDITERKQAEEELKKSEERYKALFKGAPDGIIVADVETGQYIHVNPFICKRLGYSEEEIKGLSQFRGIHPKGETDRIKRLFFMQARGEIDIAEDIPFVKKDGTIHYFDVKSVCVEIDGIQRVIGLLRDITERKKAESALHQYSHIVSSSTDMLALLNKEYIYEAANTAYIQAFNLASEQLIGHSVSEVFGEEFFNTVIKPNADRCLAGEEVNYQAWFNFPAQGKRFMNITYYPYIDVDNKVQGFVVNGRDVTERKQAEDALRESEERYRSLVENLPTVSWKSDQKGNTVFISSNVKEVYGYTAEEIYEKGEHLWFGRIHPQDKEKFKEAFDALFTKGRKFNIEYRIQRKNGNWIWLRDRAGNVSERDGILYAHGAFSDITGHKEAEEALQESEERLIKAFRASPNLMGILDERRRLLVNDTFAHVTGYSIKEITGTTIDELNFWVEPYKLNEALRLVKENGIFQDYEVDIRTKQGEIRTLKYNGAQLDIPNKNVVVFSAEDITERKQTEEALQESESRFRELVENIREVFWMENAEGTELLYVSPAYEQVWGRSCQSFYDNPKVWIEAIHPDDRQRVADAFSRFRETGVYSEEFRILRPDGSLRWIWDRGVLIRNESGELVRVAGIAEDITQRKLAEEALQHEKELSDSVVESSVDGILAFDDECRYTIWNSGMERISGVSRAQALGRCAFEVFPFLKETGEDRFFFDALEGKTVIAEDRPYRVPQTKRQGFFEGHYGPLRHERGEIKGGLAIIRDITERRQSEEALRISETRYKSLFDHMSSGVAVYEALEDGSDFIFKDLNQAGERINKVKRDDVLGRKVTEMFPAVRDFGLLEVFQRVWRTGKPEQHPVSLYTDDRLSKWFENYVYKLPSGEIVAVHDDVTEHKRAEEVAQRARAELEHTSRLITAGEMASGLAHELNQPLCAILNYADGCLRMVRTEAPDSGKLEDAMGAIAAQANRAGEIIRRIRSLVTKREPKQSTVNINDIVWEILEMEKAEASQNSITVETELAEDMPLVLADRIEIEQVVLNLVRNAFEAMSDTAVGERRLTIRTSRLRSDSIELAVCDTGQGLPADDAEKLFDSFFTTKADGLGIGLSISRSIIEAHGGRLWAEPNPDCGATFRFTLLLKGD